MNTSEIFDSSPDDKQEVDPYTVAIETRQRLLAEIESETSKIADLIKNLDTQSCREIYTRAQERILKETTWFNIFQEFGIDISLINEGHMPTKTKEGKPIFYVEDLPFMVGGYYHPFDKALYIGKSHQTASFRLYMLCNSGLSSDISMRLLHETIHSVQGDSSSMARLNNLLNLFRNDEAVKIDWLLAEAHAYRTSPYDLGPDYKNIRYNITTRSIIPLMLFLRERYLRSGRDDRMWDKIAFSITSIDQLHALGISNYEIAKLTRNHGPWDSQKAVYPKIQNYIDMIAKERNLDKLDIEGLVDLYRLNVENERLKAIKIAQEELIQFSSTP